MKRFICGLMIVSTAFLASSGCGKGGGAKSPEDAFKAANEAAKKEDVKTFMTHLTKDSQSAIAGSFVMGLGFFKALIKEEDKIQELDGLLKRHGITEEAVKEKTAGLKAGPGDKTAISKTMIALGDVVKDKGAFVDDFVKTMKKVDSKGGDNPINQIGDGTLKDVKVEGDTATAKTTMKVGGVDKTETVHFRKEDGSWKIDMIPLMEAKAMGGL